MVTSYLRNEPLYYTSGNNILQLMQLFRIYQNTSIRIKIRAWSMNNNYNPPELTPSTLDKALLRREKNNKHSTTFLQANMDLTLIY